MSLRLGDIAPNFTAQTTAGDIDFYEYLGDSWGILFSHPADYTPVCTTELGKTAALQEEFRQRNTKVLAVSVDALDRHDGWVKDINETQHVTVDFPIITDSTLFKSKGTHAVMPETFMSANARQVFTGAKISLNVKDAELSDVLNLLAKTSGKNFVTIRREGN